MAKNYGDFDFEDFSDEIILKVLSYLGLNSRFNCFFTSKRLRAICQDHTLPSLWQKIHLYDPIFLLETSKNPKNTVVKEFEEIMQQKHQLQST
jgi:2,3-bisphosphoglycerate-independent phosphoglycerate mutase